MPERKIYLPAQRSVRGKPGYIGGSRIVIVGSAEDTRGDDKAVVSTEKAPSGPSGKASAGAKPKAK